MWSRFSLKTSNYVDIDVISISLVVKGDSHKVGSIQCFFLMVFASPWHPVAGFDGCTRGTLGQIDISMMAATFINDHIYVTMPPRTMILVARHRFLGSMNAIL